MDDPHNASDEEKQRLLSPDYMVPRKRFSKKLIARRLGVIQLLVGILCLVLAILAREQRRHSSRCNCTCNKHNNQNDLLGLTESRDPTMRHVSIIFTFMGCVFIINGAVGAIASSIQAIRCLNVINFFMAILNVILSLCGIMLCTYATYYDATIYHDKSQAWLIAGVQASCYVESMTSLGIVFNCWTLINPKLCTCVCTCMGVMCSYGDDDFRDNHIEGKCTPRHRKSTGGYTDTSNSHYQSEKEERKQSSLPSNGSDNVFKDSLLKDHYEDMSIGSGLSGAAQRNCISQGAHDTEKQAANAVVHRPFSALAGTSSQSNQRLEDHYEDMSIGSGLSGAAQRSCISQGEHETEKQAASAVVHRPFSALAGTSSQSNQRKDMVRVADEQNHTYSNSDMIHRARKNANNGAEKQNHTYSNVDLLPQSQPANPKPRKPNRRFNEEVNGDELSRS